jgi:predicted alpha-1,2-mannosidase
MTSLVGKRRLASSLLLSTLTTASLCAAAAESRADLPDPLVGTWSMYELSHGNTYPGVFTPFGMLGWTAQSSEGGGWPYQYFRETLIGFLATHQPSAWMNNYGAFSLMPIAGMLQVAPAERASHFSHTNERALPYLYSVLLEAYKVKVEMAPSPRGGAFRFTFPKTDDAYVLLDANAGAGAVEIHAETNTIAGWNAAGARNAPNFKQYFVAVFDRPFTRHGVWEIPEGGTDQKPPEEPVIQADTRSRTGHRVGAYAGFSTKDGEAVTVRIGVSLIGLDQARRNLDQDMPEADFDRVVARAKSAWESQLAKIDVEGGTAAERRTFYTALYHAVQFPHMLEEIDGAGKVVHWSPYDGQVHPGEMFADTGFWDTFRAEFPLLTILEPKRDAAIIRAMLHAYDEGGFLPKWPNPGETNVMIATHGDAVIADAYAKGIRDFDAAKAYAALRQDATEKGAGAFEARSGIEDYIRLGYVPYDRGVRESVACTLEYAYDDFAVAQMAKALGRDDDYRLFIARSKNYRNVYDARTGFMRGRKSDGTWIEPFDPLDWGGVYTEGNAWQWLWSAQQDIPGLIELMGGKAAFVAKLDALFSATTAFKTGGYGRVIHEMTESKMEDMGQYAHINEPVHHVAYLYDYAGQPWKTARWVHAIEDRLYRPGPAGWLGDEDTGQMSAWYIFSALGFYPVNPGQPVYALGSPLFRRAAFHLENGRTFIVEAVGARTPADIYVQSATLNGQPLDRAWITHEEIVNGGVLQFRLGPHPNEGWGTSGLPAIP